MAKRVNTKFLAVLTTLFVGGGGVAFIGAKYLHHGNPQKYVAKGDELAAKGDYVAAEQAYHEAVTLDDKNITTLLKWGDTSYRLAGTDRDYLGKARTAYQHALEVDPGNTAAMRRLLDWYNGYLAVSAPSATFQDAADLAKQLAAADPKDAAAAAEQFTPTIRSWLSGAATPPDKVADAIAQLRKVGDRFPGNAEVPLWVGRGDAKLARSGFENNRAQDAAQRLKDANDTIDQALALPPAATDPELQLRCAEALQAVAAVDPDANHKSAAAARVKALLTQAHALAKPNDAIYPDVQIAWASQQQGDGDKPGAEKTLRALIDQRPSLPQPRLVLATLLSSDPGTGRDDAINLLAQPLPADLSATGFTAVAPKDYEIRSLIMATGLRLDALRTGGAISGPGAVAMTADRQKKLDDVTAALPRISARLGDNNPTVLRMRGELALINNEVTPAIQDLSRALSLFDQSGQPRDYGLVFELGSADAAAGQSGQAKSLLLQVIDKFPAMVPARVRLAQLFLADNQIPEAQAQVDALQALQPNDPETLRLHIAVLLAAGKQDDARRLYSSLPENSAGNMAVKSIAAAQLGEQDEALRLLQAAHAKSPKDDGITLRLADQYNALKRPDDAKALIASSLAANPDDSQLQLASDRLNAATPQQLHDDVVKQVIERDANDPYAKAMDLAAIEAGAGNYDGQVQHLKEALKVKPDDARANTLLFAAYISHKAFDQASALLPALSRANADAAGGSLEKFQLQMAQGQTTDALASANDLTAKLPEFAQSWLAAGQASQVLGRYADAVNRYNECLKRQSANADALRGLIACSYALNKPADAADYIARAHGLLPNDPQFKEARLDYVLRFGDAATIQQEVMPIREAAVTNLPNRPEPSLALASTYVRIAELNGRHSTGSDVTSWFDKARGALQTANAKFPDDGRIVAMLSGLELQHGDPAAAEKSLTDFAVRDAQKTRPEPQLALAEFYARTNKLPQAEQHLRQALALANNAAAVRIQLAGVLAREGKVDDALALVPAEENDPKVRRARVDLLLSSNRDADAETLLAADAAKAPDDASAQLALANCYMLEKKYDAAVGTVNSILSHDATNAGALLLRGQAKMWLAQPDPDGAIADLNAVVAAQPDSIEARMVLAQAQELRNNISDEIDTLSIAKAKAPENVQVRLRLLAAYQHAVPPRRSDAQALMADSDTLVAVRSDPTWLSAEAQALAANQDLAGAQAKAKAALDAAPQSIELERQYIGMSLKAKDYAAVQQETDKLVAAGQVAPWVYEARGVMHAAQGEQAGAIADFMDGLKLADNSHDHIGAGSIVTAVAASINADTAMGMVTPHLSAPPAESNYWRILAAQLDARYSPPRFADGGKLVDAAVADLGASSPAEQISILRFAGGYYLATHAAGDGDKAYQVYVKLLESTPDDLVALNNMACLLAEQVTPPRPAEALTYSKKAYDQVTRLGRFDPMVLDTHGWVLTLAGRVDDGVDVLRKVINRSPFLDAYYHIGYAYLRQTPPYPRQAQQSLQAASDAYGAAVAAKQPVDPAIKSRIDTELAKAKLMLNPQQAAAAEK